MCMRAPLLLSFLVALTASSCRYPNEFKNTPSNARHAVLRGTTYANAGHAFATHINGHPTSFWRSSDVFQIAPGTNTVRAAFSDCRMTLGYQMAEFVAIGGADYVIAREQDPALPSPFSVVPHPSTPNAWIIHDRRDRVTIRQRSEGRPGRVLADAPKEDYVFGQSTAEEALAEYQRKNPSIGQ
jgi:hypothetical protein